MKRVLIPSAAAATTIVSTYFVYNELKTHGRELQVNNENIAKIIDAPIEDKKLVDRELFKLKKQPREEEKRKQRNAATLERIKNAYENRWKEESKKQMEDELDTLEETSNELLELIEDIKQLIKDERLQIEEDS